jgi:hypothetical protein
MIHQGLAVLEEFDPIPHTVLLYGLVDQKTVARVVIHQQDRALFQFFPHDAYLRS